MRTRIESTVQFHGLSVRIDKFIDLWTEKAGNSIKKLPFKRDLRYWNDSPWSMQPVKCVACMVDRYESYCSGVYEIWERNDGMGMEVYRFDNLEDYNNYNPCQDSPHNIKNELGLCENYHAGV